MKHVFGKEYSIEGVKYTLLDEETIIWDGKVYKQGIGEIEAEKAAFDRYVKKYGLERKICDKVPLGSPRKVTGEFLHPARYPTSSES